MKQKNRKLSQVGMLLAGLLLGVAYLNAEPKIIRISPDEGETEIAGGGNPGERLLLAIRQAREWRRLEEPWVEEGIHIVLEDGRYPLLEPLLIRPEDSGTEAGPTVIRAAEGATPVLSGGLEVQEWRRPESPIPGLPEEAQEEVWVADAPRAGGRVLEFRQLWVNGRKANRARDRYGDNMNRILEWDKEKREAWIPVLEGGEISDPENIEMVIHQMWAIAILRVKTFEEEGDRVRLTFYEPENRIQFEHPWPPVVISEDGNSAYYLENHPRLLDEPGEWYQESPGGRIVYWPREDETMDEAEVFAPHLETLVEYHGTPDRPVEHIEFEGIQFSHTGWMRPSRAGHVPLQAGMYMLDAYKLKVPGTPDKSGLENQAWIGRKPAAVEVNHSRHLRFEGCHFRHLASSGLDFVEGSKSDVVQGCLFRDIGGNGLVIGAFPDLGYETHVPFDPADERILSEGARINNNLVTDVANEDWGCVGILAGYVRDTHIEYNEICDVSYTGISLGWGWTRSVNAMRDNRIHGNHIHHYGKNMYDTGGIYTLSPQPNTYITENFIHSIYRPGYVHDPNHWSYIYLDEGSSFMIVKDNWTEGLKYSTNSNGPGNTWENNGPSVSAKILQRAGLQEPFDVLRKYATVNRDSPVEVD